MYKPTNRMRAYHAPGWLGRLFNLIGKGSNWIGPNRSGGVLSFQTDRLGEYPLGDPSVSTKGWLDKRARWHDIQYYVNRHAPKGKWIEVPTPQGTSEYYCSSGGSVLLANLGLIWHPRVVTVRPRGDVAPIQTLLSEFPFGLSQDSSH